VFLQPYFSLRPGTLSIQDCKDRTKGPLNCSKSKENIGAFIAVSTILIGGNFKQFDWSIV
jgi:hypothetical protein